MPRKTALANDSNLQEAIEEWRSVTEIRYELARAAFDAQDDDMKIVMERMVDRLRLGASGYIQVHVNPPHGNLVPVKIEQQYVDFNLLYIVTELLKDLAVTGIKVGSYTLPVGLCVSCGAEIAKETRPKRRGR